MPPTQRKASSSGGREVVKMNALQRLIRSRMEELGLTYLEVGKRGGLPKPTVYALANKTEHRAPPRADTLRRLAKGLDLPLDLVRACAAEAAGFHLEDIPTTLESEGNLRIVAATFEKLDKQRQRTAARMMQALLEEMDEQEEASPSP
jgi:transcriptional regulator with XRE-family HTH domain